MKKRIVTGLFTALAVMANAQSFTEWQNPEVNAVNRAPMHTNYFAYESEGVAQTGVKEHSSRFMTLNGTWKFFWVKDANAPPLISGSRGSMIKAGAIWLFPVFGS